MWLIGIIILWLVLYTLRLFLLSLDAMAGKVLDSLEEQQHVGNSSITNYDIRYNLVIRGESGEGTTDRRATDDSRDTVIAPSHHTPRNTRRKLGE